MTSTTPLVSVLFSLLALTSAAFAGPSPTLAEDWPHQLTLYSIPSPHGMDWSSPRALGFAAVGNQVDPEHYGHKHAIGHVFVGLKDPHLPGGEDVLTGMTTESQDEEIDLALKKGYGFGVLASDMLGKFDDAEKLRTDATKRYRTGGISYLRVLLSAETGARMARYFNEYKAKGLDKHYGGSNRPRYGEGGGCSPFGVSFLDVVGLLTAEQEAAWKITLPVPARLFGGPETGHSIPTRRVFAYGRWAREDEPHVKIVMWDPSLMHDWIGARWASERQDPTGEYLPELRGRARGLVVDARERATPTEPIWLQDPVGAAHPNFRQSGNHHRYPRMSASQFATTSLAGFARREATP